MDLLGASKTTVYRWLQDTPSPMASSALDGLEALLAKQELDDHGQFQAQVARGLATKLDKVIASDKGIDAQALPQIAKGLIDVVRSIMDVSADDKAWLADVFGSVGHPTDHGA